MVAGTPRDSVTLRCKAHDGHLPILQTDHGITHKDTRFEWLQCPACERRVKVTSVMTEGRYVIAKVVEVDPPRVAHYKELALDEPVNVEVG